MLKRAGDWLLNIQEKDGNFMPIVNPLTGLNSQIDWPRSVLSAWALSELSKITDEKKYLESAKKYFKFLAAYHVFLKDIGYNAFRSSLIFAYAGDLAMSFPGNDAEYFQEYSQISEFLLSNRDRLFQADPITAAQVLSFMSAFAIKQKSTQNPISESITDLLRSLSEKLAKEFEAKSRQPNCNLAFWAELVHSFNNLSLIFGGMFYQEFIFKIADWLVGFQRKDGSFWSTNDDPNFVYVRSTGKIFEVLPDALNMAISANDDLRIKKYKKAINICLTWLRGMQYDENNVFFVKKEIRERVIGGFRHDYFNQEAWIDAAAHFILGGTRLLTLLKYGKRK